MSASVVDVERDGAVSLVTIQRPEAHNALNRDVLDGLLAAMRRAEEDPAVRAVVVTGSGARAFCAGADLKEIAAMSVEEAYDAMAAGQAVIRAIDVSSVPVVAAVNGVALGGGFELALACTMPVLATTASLGLPESGLGLMPGYGGTQRLPRLVGRPVAAYTMLTGARIDPDRAYALGLTPVPPVAPEQLLPTALDIAARLAAQGPRAVRSILSAITTGYDAPLDAALGLETGLAALAIGGRESAEGVAAFLERRGPRFEEVRE